MLGRYERQIQLSEVGVSGQNRLAKARVLVVGAGGLGCPALQYLAAAGVGTIGIADFDTVALNNLHRQLLYSEADMGENKALCAQRKLQHMNSGIVIHAYPEGMTTDNAATLVGAYDIVVDGTDHIGTRYLISDTCLLLDKPMVYAALHKFEGQVSVFNYQHGPTYRCLFPIPPEAHEIPTCNETGVLGVLPGILGLYEATEVLKIILGLDGVLSGKLFCIDMLKSRTTMVTFDKDQAEIERVTNHQVPIPVLDSCQTDVQILLSDISDMNAVIWVDLREKNETPEIALPGLQQIPYTRLKNHLALFRNDQTKIFFCYSGQTSLRTVQWLRGNGGVKCYSLTEGAEALWHRYENL